MEAPSRWLGRRSTIGQDVPGSADGLSYLRHLVIAISSAAGVGGYLGQGHFDWGLVGMFTGLAFVGVQIGSVLVPRVPQERLRRWFAVLLLVMGGVVLLKG